MNVLGHISRYFILRKLLRNVLQRRFKLLKRQSVKAVAERSVIKILIKLAAEIQAIKHSPDHVYVKAVFLVIFFFGNNFIKLAEP